jgi:glucosamine kinase
LEASFAAILQASAECLVQAGLSARDLSRIVACLALAGASEPRDLAAARRRKLPFRHATIMTDAQAACLGAHGGRDGGVVVVGTGTIAWAELNGRQIRLGGWGLVVSDEGSGAWLGRELLRRVLWAQDGRIDQTLLLQAALWRFDRDPHTISLWASKASPRDFGALAPLVTEHAAQGDPVAIELMRLAASHVDILAGRLVSLGARRLALAGGLAEHIRPWVSQVTESRLTAPVGDALDGALQVARAAAGSVAA